MSHEKSSPEDKTESLLQHSTDQWMFALLLELKESFGEVKERTAHLSESVDRLSDDLRDVRSKMVTSKPIYWGIGILVTVLFGLGGLLYHAVTIHHPQNSQPLSVTRDRSEQSHPSTLPSEGTSSLQ